jgi:hypothetical protein
MVAFNDSNTLPDAGCGEGCGMRDVDPMQDAEEECGYWNKK